MRLSFCNVGYGECQLIIHNDEVTLIDGGSADASTYEDVGTIRLLEVIELYKIRHIHNLIITHAHYDHIAAIADLIKIPNLKIDNLIINQLLPPNFNACDELSKGILDFEDYRLWKYALKAYQNLISFLKNTNIRESNEHEELFFKDGSSLEIMGLSESQKNERLLDLNSLINTQGQAFIDSLNNLNRHENNKSLSFILKLKHYKCLLTGDRQLWDSLDGKLPQCELLKLTHHGQKDGLPEVLLKNCQSNIFVICADKKRKYNSASIEVINKIDHFCAHKQKLAKTFITGILKDKQNLDYTPASISFDDELNESFDIVCSNHPIENHKSCFKKIIIKLKNNDILLPEDNYKYQVIYKKLQANSSLVGEIKLKSQDFGSFAIENSQDNDITYIQRNYPHKIELVVFAKNLTTTFTLKNKDSLTITESFYYLI